MPGQIQRVHALAGKTTNLRRPIKMHAARSMDQDDGQTRRVFHLVGKIVKAVSSRHTTQYLSEERRNTPSRTGRTLRDLGRVLMSGGVMQTIGAFFRQRDVDVYLCTLPRYRTDLQHPTDQFRAL